jgi:hypothetical protein
MLVVNLNNAQTEVQMNFFLISLLFFFSSFSLIQAKEYIPLQSTKYSNQKSCKNTNILRIKDYIIPDEFDISNGDYLNITIENNKLQPCYTFKYYPMISKLPNMFFDKNKLISYESVGSTLSGSKITRVFAINHKTKKLTEINVKDTVFFRDDDRKLVETTTDITD